MASAAESREVMLVLSSLSPSMQSALPQPTEWLPSSYSKLS